MNYDIFLGGLYVDKAETFLSKKEDSSGSKKEEQENLSLCSVDIPHLLADYKLGFSIDEQN